MVESPRARQAWADYLALGPGRSLEHLAREYQSRTESVPTRQLSRIKRWSVDFGWQARLTEIADMQAREAAEREAEYRRGILDDGYALAHERVQALKVLGQMLFAELTAEGVDSRLWVTETKGIGGGENFKTVGLERFNHHEVEQLRGVLDDIAKETGGRKQKVEHTGEDGGPILIRELRVHEPEPTEER